MYDEFLLYITSRATICMKIINFHLLVSSNEPLECLGYLNYVTFAGEKASRKTSQSSSTHQITPSPLNKDFPLYTVQRLDTVVPIR